MMRSPLWGAFYDFAILDPEYTMTMPMKQLISGSVDTLSRCKESPVFIENYGMFGRKYRLAKK